MNCPLVPAREGSSVFLPIPGIRLASAVQLARACSSAAENENNAREKSEIPVPVVVDFVHLNIVIKDRTLSQRCTSSEVEACHVKGPQKLYDSLRYFDSLPFILVFCFSVSGVETGLTFLSSARNLITDLHSAGLSISNRRAYPSEYFVAASS